MTTDRWWLLFTCLAAWACVGLLSYSRWMASRDLRTLLFLNTVGFTETRVSELVKVDLSLKVYYWALGSAIAHELPEKAARMRALAFLICWVKWCKGVQQCKSRR